MNTKKAILVYQCSERIKSELIIASGLMATLVDLEGDELNGARKVMTSFLEALLGEIRMAQNIERSVNFIGAERKVTEAIGLLKLMEHSKIEKCISEALSFSTTSCHGAVTVLMEQGLI
jgi:hypothetical protein